MFSNNYDREICISSWISLTKVIALMFALHTEIALIPLSVNLLLCVDVVLAASYWLMWLLTPPYLSLREVN